MIAISANKPTLSLVIIELLPRERTTTHNMVNKTFTANAIVANN